MGKKKRTYCNKIKVPRVEGKDVDGPNTDWEIMEGIIKTGSDLKRFILMNDKSKIPEEQRKMGKFREVL